LYILDFFAFTIELPSENRLRDLTADDLSRISASTSSSPVNATQYVIFDTELPKKPDQLALLSEALRDSGAYYSQLAPIGESDAISRIATARDAGAASVSFHPYLQNIDNSGIASAVDIAKAASEFGLLNCVCTAYGSQSIKNIDPLHVAAAIAESVSTPVVLIHGGGAKVIDAMLIADAFPNVFLDTSFSLSYWLGSSIETDMAFAMKKLGREKWIFGSDAPFVEVNQAVDDHLDFFHRHGFYTDFVDGVMGQNAMKLLERSK
jgi:predicted TIM-barrel fold metal-dependent hydrolase